MAAAPPVPAGAPAPAATPAQARSAQIALACLIVLAIVLVGRSVVSNGSWRARPTELTEAHRLDLNRASKAELLQVPGVGDKTADKILDYRSRQRFRTVDDLTHVGGIKEATLEKLRRYFYVENDDDSDVAIASSTSPAEPTQPISLRDSSSGKASSGKPTGKKSSNTEIVDINTADDKKLQTLEGIGPAHAADILRERAKAPFKSVDELTRVKGIKQATLEKIRARLTVGEAVKAE
jgi:competence ComEA-like helix-hairpin-helix protein